MTVLPEPIEEVNIEITGFTNDCIVDSLLLSSSSEYDFYEWTDSAGTVLSNEPELIIYEPIWTYNLEVSNSVGCTETSSLGYYYQPFLSTNPQLDDLVLSSEFICAGESLTLSTKEEYADYLWSTGETTPSITLQIESGITYFISVEVVNEFGCIGPDVIIGYVIESFDAPSTSPSITEYENILTAISSETAEVFYQWYLDGVPIPEATEDSYAPVVSGNYSVGTSLYGNNGNLDFICPTFSGEMFITVDSRPVEIKMILEGAYNLGTNLMNTSLLENNLLPLLQPYNTAPWNYSGTESVVNFPQHTVDWVLVEVRSGVPNLSVASTTVVASKAALLLSDGNIVAPDGGSLIFDGLNSGNYHISVRHRNHLDVLSADASTVDGIISHDFTLDVNSAFGPEQLKQMSNGKFALYSADYDPNGVILNTDYDEWSAEPAVNQVYSLTDGNLDQVVQVTDYDLWFENKAKVGIVELQY